MKQMKRFTALALTACMTLSMLPLTAAKAADGPDVKRINVQADWSVMYSVIGQEYAAEETSIPMVFNQKENAGDVLVETDGSPAVYGEEGYGIAVDGDTVTVTAADEAGAAYGLRDVLKQLKAGEVTEREVTVPGKAVRALFVDCARKYFDVNWFETVIREMAWNGMNTLYLSFSQDEGFRFLLDDMSISFDNGEGETVTYDHELMRHLADNPASIQDSEFLAERNEGADSVAQKINSFDNSNYLNQEEMLRILDFARAYGVNIIPEFNSLGHTGQILWYFPEYRRVGIWGISGNPCYGLNTESAEAKNFMTALIEKYVDFFAENGCTDFCVGGDEFKAYDSTNETIAAYLNNLVEYIESKGMTAYAWEDGQAASSKLLKDTVVLNDWDGDGSATSKYRTVNFNNAYLYYVLKASGDWWLINPEKVYTEWNPYLFREGSISPDAEQAKNIQGGCMAIWCDDAKVKSTDVILNDILTDIKAFGYRIWNYAPGAQDAPSYADFIKDASSAPALAEADVLGAVKAEGEIRKLTDEDLPAAQKSLMLAEREAADAQKKLDTAKAQTADAQKKAAAALGKEKLAAEVAVAEASAAENKLAADAASKAAKENRLKAALLKLEAQLLTLQGDASGASAKTAEANRLEAEAAKQESAAKTYTDSQAALDQAIQNKKTELANYREDPAPAPVSEKTIKKVTYRILDAKKKTAAAAAPENKKVTSVNIAKTVSIDGVTYKVTQISAKAFKGCKNLKKVTVGSNVKKIGKEAFAQCKKLSSVNLKKAGSISSIGSKAFAKTAARAKVTVPAKKYKSYVKLLKKSGLSKKAVIKK